MIGYNKIGIFGLGISGISSLNFLKDQADRIVCWDDAEINRDKIELQFLLPLSDSTWQDLDTIIISPGIPSWHEVFLLASKHNIKISSDVEIFLKINYDSEIIVITGTNGKSTVTSLIGHILKQNKLDYHVGGNIGLPVLSLPQHAKGYILELSSFQLDLLQSINPAIAVLTNLSPDHLDRHGSYTAYCAAKEKAFLGDGLKIFGINNSDSRILYEKLQKSGEKNLIAVGHVNHTMQNAISFDAKHLTDNFFDLQSYTLPKLQNLIGKHNYENIALAFAVCRALGVLGKNIIEHLSSFQGLEHRMQFIGKQKHIFFYNDSKATNISSAISALSTFDNIFWLAGGILKEKNLQSLEKSISNVKKAYLFGQSQLSFVECLQGKIDYSTHNTMEEAFNAACNDANQEISDVNIVLAPACASFDQFKNFADRGNSFINLYDARF